ncbi:MAG: hypothetical protein V4667_10920 [Bacteroidota bacterium]
MKNKIYILLLSVAFFTISFKTFAQLQVLEKTHDVSKKARKGDLSSIDFNEEKGIVELIYILPEKMFAGNKIRSEVYTYNKDLELLSTEQVEVEKEKLVRSRGGKIKEDISYITVDAVPVFAIPMKIAFKKKEVARRFNWLTMRYQVSEKLLDKITPKTAEDEKYTWGYKYDVLQDKSVLVLSGKHKKKTANMTMYYDILRCDVEGNVTVTDSINFKRPYISIYSAPLKDLKDADEFELTRDWIMVFAPAVNKTFPDVKPTLLTYVRISPAGKVLERFEFDSPSNCWQISSALEKDGSVYMYGGAITKSPEKKYYYETYKAKAAMTNLQICKITKGKLDFISSPAIKDLASNQAKPTNQKKAVVFDGKAFQINSLEFNDKGEVLLICQDGLEKKFNTNYMFKFDANGVFKKYYNVILTADGSKGTEGAEKWAEPIQNYFATSGDGKFTYWFMRSTKLVKCKTYTAEAKDADGSGGMAELVGEKTTICFAKRGLDICTINNETGEMSELKALGREKKDEYYLFENAGYVVKMGNFIFTAGENIKGDKIMLSRVDVSK